MTLGAAAFAESAESKAWRIQVPLFELRDASIDESIRALAAKSRDLDPTHEGVNLVWPKTLPAETRLNLRLANVPLREAARYVARLAGAQLTATQHALVFAPADAGSPPPANVASPAAQTAAGLILPRVELADATLPEALDFLASRGRAIDPKKQGVNVVVAIPPEMRETRITLSLRNVPLGEALRYAADLANLIVLDEAYALVVTTPKPKPGASRDNDPGATAAPPGQPSNASEPVKGIPNP